MKKDRLLAIFLASLCTQALFAADDSMVQELPVVSDVDMAVNSDQDDERTILEEKEMSQNWKHGNEPVIGIDEKNRQGLVTLLNGLLADEFVLYARTLNYHWNVVGPHFGDLHQLFKNLYESQLQIADTLAERVRALGGKSIGTLKEFLTSSTVEEASDIREPNEMVASLLKGYEAIISRMRQDIEDAYKKFGDSGTNNMLSEIIVKHEKSAWMLRSIIDEKNPCCTCDKK